MSIKSIKEAVKFMLLGGLANLAHMILVISDKAQKTGKKDVR